jgi:hypothetical protein
MHQEGHFQQNNFCLSAVFVCFFRECRVVPVGVGRGHPAWAHPWLF